MTTHILEIAERICDRVGIITKGQLIAVGTLAELQQKRQEGHGRSVESGQDGTETLEDIFLDLTSEFLIIPCGSVRWVSSLTFLSVYLGEIPKRGPSIPLRETMRFGFPK